MAGAKGPSRGGRTVPPIGFRNVTPRLRRVISEGSGRPQPLLLPKGQQAKPESPQRESRSAPGRDHDVGVARIGAKTGAKTGAHRGIRGGDQEVGVARTGVKAGADIGANRGTKTGAKTGAERGTKTGGDGGIECTGRGWAG